MSSLNIPRCSFHKSYPHQPAHCPDFQRLQQHPWEEASGKTLRSPARWSGCLAKWPTQLRTQIMSPTPPTSSATWTRSTRRSTPTATSISSAKMTPLWSPPQIQKVCRTQEYPAAAKTSACRVPSMFGPSSLWKQMAGHVSGRTGLQETGFRTENLLQQRFFSSQTKGKRDRDIHVVHRWKIERISAKSLSGKLNWPSEERNWLSKKRRSWGRRGSQTLGKENSDIALHETIRSWNLNGSSYNKQVDGQIRLKEMKSVCMENWNWEIDSSKKVKQKIAKKLKKWEEFVAKTQIEQDNQELMNRLCIKRGNQRQWVNCWLRFRNCRAKRIPCLTQENFMILNQGAALERPTFPVNFLLFWVSERCLAAISGLPLDTWSVMSTSGNVLERPSAQEGRSSTIFNNSKNLALSSQ